MKEVAKAIEIKRGTDYNIEEDSKRKVFCDVYYNHG